MEHAFTFGRSVASKRVLAGPAATRLGLARELPRSRFVHLAAHARFNEDHPSFSYVQLARGDRLYSLDLDGLSFEGRHVFLSACETGLGQAVPGDDVYGLANAFIASGVASTVASLWRVESASTGREEDV